MRECPFRCIAVSPRASPAPAMPDDRVVGHRRRVGLAQAEVAHRLTGEGTKVIVEAVVLFNDDHNMLDWILGFHGY